MRQVARAGAAGGDAREQSLHVVDAAELVAQVVAGAAVGDEFGHRVQAIFDRGQFSQWIGHPIGQQPRAHRGLRAVQDRQQRSIAPAFAQCLGDLQAAARRFVDFQSRASVIRQEPIEMCQRGLLCFGEIIENGAGGSQRRGIESFVETEAFERGRAEVLG